MANDNDQIENVSDAFDSVYADYVGASLSALSTILFPLSEKVKITEARIDLVANNPVAGQIDFGTMVTPSRLAPAITRSSQLLTGITFLYDTVRAFNSAIRDNDKLFLGVLISIYGGTITSLITTSAFIGASPAFNAFNRFLDDLVPFGHLLHGGYIIYTMIDDPEENVTVQNIGDVITKMPAPLGQPAIRLQPWYPVVIVVRTAGMATSTVGRFIEAADRSERQRG